MIPYNEALETALAHAPEPIEETVPLHQANRRVLAQEIRSDHDMPPFNKSAMDGYACRAADLPGPLHCLETIAAGSAPKNVINTGRCARIMTGAVVPEGADCVFMVEESLIMEDNAVRFTGTGVPDNIFFKGTDVKSGDIVLTPGTLLGPSHLAVLAAAGYSDVRVAKPRRVGILATGSELIPPTEPVTGASIRETSGTQLIGQVEACGCIPTYYGIVEDDREKIAALIHQAVSENDVVLICGGSSVGDFDFVPELLQQSGFNIAFDRVAIQPGKPLTLACGKDKTCFGMPGNPVSTFMVMEAIVKPFLYRAMGHDFKPTVIQLKLGKGMTRRKTDRMAFVPGTFIQRDTVERLNYHGSAHIHAITQADGWVIFPMGEKELTAGSLVDFWML